MSNSNYNKKTEFCLNIDKFIQNISPKQRRSIKNDTDKLKYLILLYGHLPLKQKPKTLNIFWAFYYIYQIYQARINEMETILSDEHADPASWCQTTKQAQQAKTAALFFLNPQSQNPTAQTDKSVLYIDNTQWALSSKYFEWEVALQNEIHQLSGLCSQTEAQIIQLTDPELEELYESETIKNTIAQTDKSVLYIDNTQWALSSKLNGSVPYWLGDLFINTEVLQTNFKIKCIDYLPYFEAWVEMEEEWSYSENRCRRIVRFKECFIKLIGMIGQIYIPEEWLCQYQYSIEQLPEETLQLVERFYNECEDEQIKTKIKWQKWSHSTRVSPFRIYNPLVNVSRKIRKEIFKGKVMCDLVAAFATISYYELDMKNCELEGANLLNPLRKKELRQKIMESFKGTDLDKAKQTSQYLFSDAYQHSWGVEWFDKLHKEISNRVNKKLKEKKKVEWKNKFVQIDTYHKFFTYHEQLIMQQLKQNILLQIHDGVIFNFEDAIIFDTNRLNSNKIEYNGNIYYFSFETI